MAESEFDKEDMGAHKNYYIVNIERIIAEIEITQQRPIAVDKDTDPMKAAKEYYSEFWGPQTNEAMYDNGFQRPDGGEAVRIENCTEIDALEYSTLTRYINEIPTVSSE